MEAACLRYRVILAISLQLRTDLLLLRRTDLFPNKSEWRPRVVTRPSSSTISSMSRERVCGQSFFLIPKTNGTNLDSGFDHRRRLRHRSDGHSSPRSQRRQSLHHRTHGREAGPRRRAIWKEHSRRNHPHHRGHHRQKVNREARARDLLARNASLHPDQQRRNLQPLADSGARGARRAAEEPV